VLTQEMRDDVFAVRLEEDEPLASRTLHLLGTFAHAVAFAGGAALDLA